MAKATQKMADTPQKGVAVKEEDRGLVQSFDSMPDFMRGDMGKGAENIDRADLEVPRLKLMQGLSPELDLFDNLKPGMFFHTANEFVFDKPILVVPIFTDKRYLLWNPRDNGGGILARADDAVHWQPANTEFKVKLDKKDGGDEVTWKTADTVAASGLADWGSMNPKDTRSPPAATLMFNYLFAFPEYPDLMPAVFSFQRTSVGVGRKLNTKVKTSRAPMFGTIFQLSSVDDSNAVSQKFKAPQITAMGLLKDSKLYAEYKKMHEAFSNTGLKIKDEDKLQDEGNEADGGDEEKGTPNY